MKNKMLLIFLIILCFNLSNISVAEAIIPSPVGEIYVQDFANVLSSSEKEEIINLGKNLEVLFKVQISVLVVDTLGNYSTEEYAYKAFEKFKLGAKEKNKGALLLISTKEKQVHIQVGDGLESILTNLKTVNILNTQALPYLGKGQIGDAILNTYKNLYNEINSEYEVKAMNEESTDLKTNSLLLDISRMLICIIIILLCICFGFYKRGSRSNGNDEGSL